MRPWRTRVRGQTLGSWGVAAILPRPASKVNGDVQNREPTPSIGSTFVLICARAKRRHDKPLLAILQTDRASNRLLTALLHQRHSQFRAERLLRRKRHGRATVNTSRKCGIATFSKNPDIDFQSCDSTPLA